MVKIRTVRRFDLDQLLEIESSGFTIEEAATKEAFEQRITYIADSFFVAEVDGQVVGLINGPVIGTPFITDDLFAEIKENPPSGGHQSVLGLAVHPDFQKRGIASALLNYFEQEASAKRRTTITLTCKENLIHFYEERGYQNHGVSNSEHGGVVWYNMSKTL
ncbi:MAG: N-acetyltransferase [Bacillus sp. (in: firmicutes)]